MTPASSTEPVPFDVREFARTAQGSLRDELDLQKIAAAGLPPDVERTLATLGVLEGATMARLRNVLVTSMHKDARVTAFLVTWAYEKFWIADALNAIVAVNTHAAAAAIDPRESARRAAAVSTDRGPIRRALAGFAQGWAIIGAQTTIALVDDWMLREAYESTAESAGNAPLRAAVERILAVKARHTRFFEHEARRRLAESSKAARLARRELRRTPWPLGASALTRPQRDTFHAETFGGEAGARRAASVEQRIAELPGIGEGAAASVGRTLAVRSEF